MPGSRHSGRQRGPLANLPRPLDERDGSRRRRRVRRAASLVVVVGVTAGIAATLANLPLGRVGEVQGAVATPGQVAVRATATPSPSVPSLTEATASPTPSASATPSLAPTPAPPETLVGYRSPLPHGRLTLPFGPSPWGSRLVEGKAFHDGVDLATFCGDHIKAAHDGTVLAASRRFDTEIGLGRQPQALLRATRPQAPVGNPADHGRHRRWQRVSQHLCPLQQGRREEGSDRQGRSAPRLRRA